MTPAHRRRLALATFASLLALLAWDAGGLDLPLARWFGTPQGFALTGHWLLTGVLHDGGRLVAWALVTVLAVGVWWPWGWLRTMHSRERLQLVLSALVSVLAVSLLKGASTTSCPWDLADFGGTARHVSHWVWRPDGGAGHCFPAGHASSGFAFLGGYFALHRNAPGRARAWLAAALLAGLGLGLAQQVRGAHFMSHTLWTAWLCWAIALGVDAAMRRRRGCTGADMPPGPPDDDQGPAERSTHAATAAASSPP